MRTNWLPGSRIGQLAMAKVWAGALELYCRPVAGQPPLDLKSDYGNWVYFGVMPQGGAGVEAATGVKRELMKAPLTGEELPHSQWVRRKKERFYFSGDSGKTGYFCVRYENGKGETGPWGPLFQATGFLCGKDGNGLFRKRVACPVRRSV